MRRLFINFFGWIVFTLIGNWVLKKVPAALTENAVSGWIDDRLGEYLNLTAPETSTVIDFLWNWGLPAFVVAIALWLYHEIQKHWGYARKDIARPNSPKPRLSAIYDPHRAPCRKKEIFNDGRNGVVYRIEVENVSDETITAVEGYLTEVAFGDDETEFGSLPLFWSGKYPPETRIDLLPIVKRYLDILVIYKKGQVAIISPIWPPNNRLDFFSRRGHYRFTIVIGGNGVTLPPYKLRLNFTGDWNTSTMEPI